MCNGFSSSHYASVKMRRLNGNAFIYFLSHQPSPLMEKGRFFGMSPVEQGHKKVTHLVTGSSACW